MFILVDSFGQETPGLFNPLSRVAVDTSLRLLCFGGTEGLTITTHFSRHRIRIYIVNRFIVKDTVVLGQYQVSSLVSVVVCVFLVVHIGFARSLVTAVDTEHPSAHTRIPGRVTVQDTPNYLLSRQCFHFDRIISYQVHTFYPYSIRNTPSIRHRASRSV